MKISPYLLYIGVSMALCTWADDVSDMLTVDISDASKDHSVEVACWSGAAALIAGSLSVWGTMLLHDGSGSLNSRTSQDEQIRQSERVAATFCAGAGVGAIGVGSWLHRATYIVDSRWYVQFDPERTHMYAHGEYKWRYPTCKPLAECPWKQLPEKVQRYAQAFTRSYCSWMPEGQSPGSIIVCYRLVHHTSPTRQFIRSLR